MLLSVSNTVGSMNQPCSLMDVATAIEGTEHAFRCTEIRRRGSGAAPARFFGETCAVTTSMRRAELAWRKALAAQTIADVGAEAEAHAPGLTDYARRAAPTW